MFANYIKCKSEHCIKTQTATCWEEADCTFEGHEMEFSSIEQIKNKKEHSLGTINYMNNPGKLEKVCQDNYTKYNSMAIAPSS